MRRGPPEPPPLIALTVRQPWAWAITHAGRRIENRDWRPPSELAWQPLAIHAGRAWTRNEKLDAAALSSALHGHMEVPLGAEGYVFGSIVALAHVVGFVDLDPRTDRGVYSFISDSSHGPVAVGGRLTRRDIEAALSDRWWRGPCGWLLDDIRPLPHPVASRGHEKLWVVPAPEALAVAAQVGLG
ncbi:MAG: hypothetical protein KC620_15825 [Myxococcales bacterium]|nr:hypothetical protein [Myxococcales bacterium]